MTTNLFKVQFRDEEFSSANKFNIQKIYGLNEIPIRTDGQNLINQDGGLIYVQRYSPRELAIEGVLWGETPQEYFEKEKTLVTSFQKINEDEELTITRWEDGISRSIDVRVVSMPNIVEQIGRIKHNSFRVELRAINPFFKDPSSTMYTFQSNQTSGFPLRAPLRMPLGTSINNTVIENTGDVSTYAELIRIYGQVTNPTITNVTTGESFTILTTIPAGQYIEVYKTNQRTYVMLNGTIDYGSYFSGTLVTFDIGNNIIGFNGESISGGYLEITFRNKYLTFAS